MKKTLAKFLPLKILSSARKHKFRTIIVLVILVAFFYFVIRPRFFPSGNGFETALVTRGEVQETLILSGEVNAETRASLAFATPGKIAWVGVSEGDMVYSGQVLMRLDRTSLISALNQARSNLRAAEASLERVYDDVKGHDEDESFTSKETRTAAEVAKDRAYQAVVQAEDALNHTVLYAPVTGTVTYVANPVAGVAVSVAQPQVEIVDLATRYFEVFADQTEVVNIREGAAVDITLEAYSDQTFKGVVTKIAVSPNPEEISVVYGVDVQFTETAGTNPKVGMTGDATFVLTTKSDVLRVPSEFIQADSDGDYLLTNKGKTKVRIEVGTEGEEWAEIWGEITEGTIIYDD